MGRRKRATEMHLHNSVNPKESPAAPSGAGNLFTLKPRAHARGYTLPPADAGSSNGFLKLTLLLLLLISNSVSTSAQPARTSAPSIIEVSSLNREITDFFDKELAAHLNDIKSYDPPPDKVFAAGTTGEYTWGSFMNAVGAYAAWTGRRRLDGHSLAREG